MNENQNIIESPFSFLERIGIVFNDVSIINRALTHRSYINEHPDALEDNERLEFLGDAVLDFLVGDWLYNRFPEMEEGELTQMRSALVRTSQLAEFARTIVIENAIRLGRGEVKTGGKLRNTLLCDVFEAFIGALYLDQGLDVVRKFMDPILEKGVYDVVERKKVLDSKSVLQEWAQANGYAPPKYHLKSVSGPDHAKIFKVEVKVNNKVFGSGEAHSKQSAEKIAAEMALGKIGRLY